MLHGLRKASFTGENAMVNPLGIARAGCESDFATDTFRCNINVSDICNFSCSYCINSASKNKGKRILDKDILSGFIEDVAARNCERYYFSIAGGEPLIYPHIVYLVEKISETIEPNRVNIGFATNGSKLHGGEVQSKLYGAAKGIHLEFSVSVHLEQIDLLSFAAGIQSFGHPDNITCKILLAPGKLDECKKMLELFDRYGINVVLQPVTKTGGQPLEYTPEELAVLNRHNTVEIKHIFHDYDDGRHEEFDRITRTLNPQKINYRGMRCMAGARTLRLGPDGEVIPCFGAWAVKDGSWRYNISERRLRDIPELDIPRVCPADYCSCLTFLRTPKWSHEDMVPSYCKKEVL